MKMKFVTFLDYHGEQIIVFPDHIQHLQFAKAVNNASYSDMRPIAGGFVVNGECVGESVSLGMSSRPEDTELLKTLQGSNSGIGITIGRPDYPIGIERGINPLVMTKNQRKRLNKKRK